MCYPVAMYPHKQKTKLYITDLIPDPEITYPAWYLLSRSMAENEKLHDALTALHTCDMAHYHTPRTHEQIFQSLHRGAFGLYKEKYVVGYFGGKMMYLASHGWKSMPLTEEAFVLENWRIA